MGVADEKTEYTLWQSQKTTILNALLFLELQLFGL